MNSPILTFFNNKGDVGKTSLIYHLAWMYASLSKRVIVADIDPQANLTAAFLTQDKIEKLWSEQQSGFTIYQCVRPLLGGANFALEDIIEPQLQKIATDLYLLPGDVELSVFEDTLSNEWSTSMGDKNLYRSMQILSSFWQVIQKAAAKAAADIILVDIGPNLGAINRSVLLATDYVAIPLGADLFSLQGLKNLGPTLKSWKSLWKKRLYNWEESSEHLNYPVFILPRVEMQPVGYLCQQPNVWLDTPIKTYEKWLQQIPQVYRESLMDEEIGKKMKMIPIAWQQSNTIAALFPWHRSFVSLFSN
jgi:cellulose biosynthesis protein BcsQ